MTHREKREVIVEQIKEAAQAYKDNLVGNSYMYVFDNRYIEVLYKTERFLHLTGADTNLGAKDFYKKSIKRQLTQKQIFFSERHPYDLCKRKMEYLSAINKLTCENIKVLEDITTESAFYVFGFTEMNFTLGLFEDRDLAGTLKSEFLIPASLRTDDCISKSRKVHNINLILKKSNTEKYYNEIMYTDSTDIKLLPIEIKSKIKLK